VQNTFSGHADVAYWRNAFLLTYVYILVAAASYSGFYNKWRLSDGQERYSIILMLDGDAHRPFVYRQLMPQIANALDRITPTSIKDKVVGRILGPVFNRSGMQLGLRQGDVTIPTHTFRYYVVYMLGFFALLPALFLMRRFCLSCGCSEQSATAAPAIFALAIPILQSVGGYFYDFGEIFFLFATLCLIDCRYRWLIVPLTAIATFNKESYLFYLLSISPLLWRGKSDRETILICFGSILVAGLTYLVLRAVYAVNPGATAEFHLFSNLMFYLNPLNLLSVETTYGILLFSGYSLVTVLAFTLLISLSLPRFDGRLRAYAITAVIINVSLFLLFAAPGETRNLSLLYPVLVLLIAFAIDRVFEVDSAV
jgi:hypothetical protein